jgi:biopolymer transport protein ExbD
MYAPEPMSTLRPEISVVPLVGVLQALLFVFLFSAPPRDQPLSFDPLAPLCWGASCPTLRIRTVMLNTNEGTIDLRLEGESVDLLTLLARLRHARGDDQLAVNMDTGMDVPYSEFARLLAALRRAGFDDIRFAEFQRSWPLDRDSWRRGW